MRLTTLGLLVPLLAAACGQSLQPLNPFDAGFTGDDLSAGGGSSTDMARARDLGGTDGALDDTTGPTIVIVTPAVGDFVSGVFTVAATITDPSGVDPSSVIAEFGNNPNATVSLKHATGDTYTALFDVHTLATNYVLAAISVRAKDLAGNESQLGEEVVVDIVKPWMTMNSALTMNVSKHDSTGAIECSRPFSPVGSDAAYDGQVVQQLITLRARIEDHGNEAPGLAIERFSRIDPTSVQLFVIHDDGQTALAVDTDGNGFCDDVNPLLIPTAGPVMMQGEALSLQLAPIPSQGTPDYELGTATSFCPKVGDAATTTPPKSICTDTPMTYALVYGSPPDPAIWTLPPVKTGDPNDCSGYQLDAANQLPEGPACVITRASDKAGNVEVSFPLHICIDFNGGKCGGFTAKPERCTGVLDKVNMTVSGTCAPPPPPTPTRLDGPATFPTDGSDVEFVGP